MFPNILSIPKSQNIFLDEIVKHMPKYSEQIKKSLLSLCGPERYPSWPCAMVRPVDVDDPLPMMWSREHHSNTADCLSLFQSSQANFNPKFADAAPTDLGRIR